MSAQKEWIEFEKSRDEFRSGKQNILQRLRFLVKMALQRYTRGYDDRDIWNLDEAITRFVYPRFNEYLRWQQEHGRHTPEEFEMDPAGWIAVLYKIQEALRNQAANIGLEPGIQYDPTMNDDGLILLGRYFKYFWD